MPDLKNIWEHKLNILKGATNNFVRTKVIEDIAKTRLEICNNCSSKSTDCAPLIKSCCSICGCSLAWKSRVPEEACPDNKWPSLKIN